MHDIFISYRRDTGSSDAGLIHALFKNKGINAFLDSKVIRNENFFNSIKRHIDASPNYLMILTPGYMVRRNGEDWVRREIEYAVSKKKNIIGLAFDQYNHAEVDWANEESDFANRFALFNYFKFDRSLEDASLELVINAMVDPSGKKFSTNKSLMNNPWYSIHDFTPEDKLWIEADHDVCKKLDWEVLDKALGEKVFGDRKDLSMLVYKAYDIDTYDYKYSLGEKRTNPRRISDVYGFTYDFLTDYANNRFGKGHFFPDIFTEIELQNDRKEHFQKTVRKMLADNHLKGFDLIDLTLVIKDRTNPDRIVRQLTEYLNPEGGIIYIRELDDHLVYGYPDDKGLIKKMLDLLRVDYGAGNRYTGMKIYTYLREAGAQKIYMSDKIISTANLNKAQRQRIVDAYFSYLKPEMRILAKEHPENDDYQEGNEWLNQHYGEVEDLFASKNFYFRTGHVLGYGVFVPEDEDD